MNIHFSNSTLFSSLMESSLFQIEIGSPLYSLNTESSDKDILIIYADSLNQEKSFLWEHHQLQFKKDNTDFIFTNLSSFIRNILTGDSLINFEVIHTSSFEQSSLSFISDLKMMFYNYNILKAHLGFLKRDLKSALTNDKKLSHAYRVFLSFNMIFESINKGTSSYILNLKSNDQSNYQILKNMKNGLYKNKHEMIKVLSDEQNKKRSLLTNLLNAHKIEKVASIEQLRKLDEYLIDFKNSNTFKLKQKNLDLNEFYSALSKDISYS